MGRHKIHILYSLALFCDFPLLKLSDDDDDDNDNDDDDITSMTIL